MKKRYFNPLEMRRPFDWFGFGFVGLVLIATGTLALLTGETHYPNFWGAPVFAPFAIVIGLLLLVTVFTQWRKWK
jgi:multisubunit Na+/H+ antiporter MnhB subunit